MPNASSQTLLHRRSQYLMPIFFLALLNPTIAMISQERPPVESSKPALVLDLPVPLEKGQERPPKPYFNPKTYTVADYYVLVHGFSEEMKREMTRFDSKTKNVESMITSIEELVKKVTALESKMEGSSSSIPANSLLPMLNETNFLFALFGVLWVVLAVAIMVLGFNLWRHRENQKYSSVEKLINN
ncbi:hypothetical protein DdX_20227 [Ditylenchus destructor]|uniref:Uncharacterized protein n=1 Tax=Ditylenchus destructor TaxID=166010 RepID=A0AAD4MHJ3_9BILA|nr:hypothetical protein DdX_20227 [Ditylenchus destructor]